MLPPQNIHFTSIFLALWILLSQPIYVLCDVPYPAAQPCFDSATAAAKCDNSTAVIFNTCACNNNGNWLYLSAICIESADKSQLTTIYNSLESNCAGTSTPIVFSLDQWLAAAGSSSSATQASVGTSTTPATSTTAKVSTLVQTSAMISTVTLAPSGGQSTPIVSIMTFTPGQTAASGSIMTVIQSGSTAVVTVGTAQATASPSPAAPLSTDKRRSKLGMIIGIAVGVPCFLALIGVLLFFTIRKRKQLREMAYNPHDSAEYEGVSVGKNRPQSTPTVLLDTDSRPSYQYSGSTQLGARPVSDIHVSTYQQQTVSQQPYSMNSVSQDYHQRFSATNDISGTVELPGQPIARFYELPGHVG